MNDPQEARRLALIAFEHESLPLAEPFLNAYLRNASDDDLINLITACPALMHALIQRTPHILERPVFWQSFPERRDSLVARLLTLPLNDRNALDWTKITPYLLSDSSQGLSNDLVRQLPNIVFELLLDLLQQQGDFNLYEAWQVALSARADEVIEWMAKRKELPLPLLLWVCHHLDEPRMWSSRLDVLWEGVGLHLSDYPASVRGELATQVLCTLVKKDQPDVTVLLNIFEAAQEHLGGTSLSYKHEGFLHNYLPRLKKSEDDWDLRRRLDKWVANILKQAGISKSTVLKSFKKTNFAERLLRYLKKL